MVKLTAESKVLSSTQAASGWSSSSDEGEEGGYSKRKKLLSLKKRFEKAENKQFMQKQRKKDILDKEYDMGKQRKSRKNTAFGGNTWSKATSLKQGSMSDKF